MSVALLAASFLAAYGDDLSGILFGDGVAVDVAVLAQANPGHDLGGVVVEGPVPTGRLDRDARGEAPILLLVAEGARRSNIWASLVLPCPTCSMTLR